MALPLIIRNVTRRNLFKALGTTYPRVLTSENNLKNEQIEILRSRIVSPVSLMPSSKHISTSIPKMSADIHGDHTTLWTVERGVSAALLALCPAAFVIQNPVMDYALALSLAAHIHWGLEAIVVDYIRPRVTGQFISNSAIVILHAVSIIMLGGLFYFNYTDVGLVHAIKMLWNL